nr:hypothetical protein [Sulfitobacter sediminilitoris]
MNGEVNDQKDARQHHDLKSNRAIFCVQELWKKSEVKERDFWVQQV